MTNFSDLSLHFSVCSGAEDKHGYIWDRHYNICLARLAHDDVVNSVAFSPADQELLLSASDDSTIKVWRSPRMVRLAQAPPRPSKPRSLLSSWLSRNKNSTSASNVTGKPWARLDNAKEWEGESLSFFLCGVNIYALHVYVQCGCSQWFCLRSWDCDQEQCSVSPADRRHDVSQTQGSAVSQAKGRNQHRLRYTEMGPTPVPHETVFVFICDVVSEKVGHTTPGPEV